MPGDRCDRSRTAGPGVRLLRTDRLELRQKTYLVPSCGRGTDVKGRVMRRVKRALAGVRSSGLTWLGTLLMLVTGLGLAGSAGAAVYQGEIGDPSGDGPEPSRDLVSAKVRYDSETGALRFVLRTAGTPESVLSTQFYGGVGRRDGDGGCSPPYAAIGTILPGTTTVWMRDNGSGADPEGDSATRQLSGQQLILNASSSRLNGLRPDCAVAAVTDFPATTVWDSTSIFPVRTAKPEKRRARLRVRLVGVPKKIRRGRSFRAKVRVTNRGTARARTVRIRAGGTARVRPHGRLIGGLPRGRTVTRALRVTAGPRARGRLRLRVRATARNAKAATAKAAFRVKVPQPPAPPPSASGPVGHLYWGVKSRGVV